MRKKYPLFKKGEVLKIVKNLTKSQQQEIKDFVDYCASHRLKSESKKSDVGNMVAQFMYILDKDYKKLESKLPKKNQDKNIPLELLRNYLKILNESGRRSADGIKVWIRKFLKWKFRDYSERFRDFEDIRVLNMFNELKINSDTIFKKKDIKTCMQHEHRTYWKTFFMILTESALRQKECRELKWNDVKLNTDGDISELSIYATKTEKHRPAYVKDATFYLKKLKEEQEHQGIDSPYVFPSPKNPHKSISKNSVNYWFRNLTLKALGKKSHPYILRHSRGTELYRMAEKGEISKDAAVKIMGHSKDMSQRYTHLDKEDVQAVMTQVYNLEDLPPEKKHRLEEEIEKLKKGQEFLMKFFTKNLEEDHRINLEVPESDEKEIVQVLNKIGIKHKVT